MGAVNLRCNWCGRPCFKDAILSANPDQEAEQKWFAICPQCYSMMKTCAMCKEAQSCDFETNPDPSPKQVQQTIRKGQMVMQTIVQNPDRVEKTCKTNCKCWNDEFGCLKQNGTCGNYKDIMPNAEV